MKEKGNDQITKFSKLTKFLEMILKAQTHGVPAVPAFYFVNLVIWSFCGFLKKRGLFEVDGFQRRQAADQFLVLEINLPVGEAGEVIAGCAVLAVVLTRMENWWLSR